MSREEQEQRRRMRREEEERWKKLVTYYLFQKYAKEKAETEKKYEGDPMPVLMAVLSARGIAARLFEKRPGAMSALDILAALERFEEPESPMMELLRVMREEPGNAKELNRCVARCITEEPLRLSRKSWGLRLLQHVRDESHRFAQHYHHILRRKSVLGDD